MHFVNSPQPHGSISRATEVSSVAYDRTVIESKVSPDTTQKEQRWKDILKRAYLFQFHPDDKIVVHQISNKLKDAVRFEVRRAHGLKIHANSHTVAQKCTSLFELEKRKILDINDFQFLSNDELRILSNSDIIELIKRGLLAFNEALDLKYAEILKLSSYWIKQLILDKKLTVLQALNLDTSHYLILNNQNIYEIIKKQISTLDEIFSLSDREIEWLQASEISKLIINEKLSIHRLKLQDIDDKAIKKLGGYYVNQLIYLDIITVEEVISLSKHDFVILNNERIFRLICDGKLESTAAIDPSYRFVIPRLTNEYICRLICMGILTLEDVKNLSDASLDKLGSEGIYKLLLELIRQIDKVADKTQDFRNVSSSSSNLATSSEKRSKKLSFDNVTGISWVEQQINKANGVIEHVAKRLSWWMCGMLNNEALHRLMAEGVITLADFHKLTVHELENLSSQWVCNLIIQRKMSIKQAKSLKEGVPSLRQNQRDNLNSEWIYTLIREGKLSVKQAKGLHEDQFRKLNQEAIATLVCRNKLSIDRAYSLTDEQCRRLGKKWIYKHICAERGHRGELTIGQLIAMSDAEYSKIANLWIFKLIGVGVLSLDAAKKLGDIEIARLSDEVIYKQLCQTYRDSNVRGLKLDRVRTLSDADFLRFQSDAVLDLITRGILTADEVIRLDHEQLKRLETKAIRELIFRGELDVKTVFMLPETSFRELVVYASQNAKTAEEGAAMEIAPSARATSQALEDVTNTLASVQRSFRSS